MTVDMVNHPPHYQSESGLEVIDFLEEFFKDDPLGWQVGKYITRYKKKNGVEDLKKAEFYLKRLISKLEGAQAPETEPLADWEKELLGIPRVLEALTLGDLADGTAWADKEGSRLELVGGNVRRTYPRHHHETDNEWWIKRALTAYGPYTEVLDG